VRRSWIALLASLPGLGAGSSEATAAQTVAPSERDGALSEAAGEILEAACTRCHGPALTKGGLDLTTRVGLLRGGESGAAVVLATPGESLLLKMVLHEEAPGMPLRASRLPEAQLEILRAWLTAGAPYARRLAVPATKSHWAFAPLPAIPDRVTIDDLVEAKLHREGLRLAAPLPPAALARRLSIDLRGLPPDARASAFAARPTAAGWRALVEAYLQAPAFGERWAQHWLDVARYADSDGFEADRDRPFAWPYRDFVIRALNADLPFDRFVALQVAGDELAPDEPAALAATGFLAAGASIDPVPTDTDENKQRLRADELDDWVATVSEAFLGLTVGCARCHDHKFDPISTREYHQMAALFQATRRRDLPLAPGRRRFEALQARSRATLREARMEALGIPAYERMILRVPRMPNNPMSVRIYKERDERLRLTDDELLATLSDADRRAWREAQAEAAAERDDARVLAVTDATASPGPFHLLRRGDVRTPGEVVLPGFLSALGGAPGSFLVERPRGERGGSSTYRRAALAAWLTDVERGAGRLVARVAVNRLWQHHFGEGLVGTPNDFGTQVEAPAQLDVVDLLARRLIDAGWRTKAVHRLILHSRTYQQGDSPVSRRLDPTNRLLGRREPRRLEAEALRDALLATAGILDERLYGPAIKPPIPAAAMATRTADAYPTEAPDRPALWRRSIYVFNKRSVRHPLLEAFDKPVALASCGRRTSSTVPTQGLALLNDGFVRARAADFATRLLSEAGADPGRQVQRAFRVAFGRTPRPEEHRLAQDFLEAQQLRRAGPGGTPSPAIRHGALIDLAHALFITHEQIHVD
jgi:cytochrome c553